MTKTTLPTLHIYWDTKDGRKPFTAFVFGPYRPYSDPEWDVEVYSGHINDEERSGRIYVGTVSSLKRDTHIVSDIWNWMDANV
jgi:hypothetical protein